MCLADWRAVWFPTYCHQNQFNLLLFESVSLHSLKSHHQSCLTGGDAWSVPVMGAVLCAVLTGLLPYKINRTPPMLLGSFMTHDDFPIEAADWGLDDEETSWELIDNEVEDSRPTPNWRARVSARDPSIAWGL